MSEELETTNIKYDKNKIYIYKGVYKLHRVRNTNAFTFVSLDNSFEFPYVEDTFNYLLHKAGTDLLVFDSFNDFVRWRSQEQTVAALEALHHGLRLANVLPNKESIAVKSFATAVKKAINNLTK